jgi:hypothetical protein
MPPRGVIVSTAETPPQLSESALARTLLVELPPGAVNVQRLSAAQAGSTALAEAMAAFIGWAASSYEELEESLPLAFEAARRDHQRAGHRRVPEALANLEVAAATALTAFQQIGAIDDREAARVMARIRRDLNHLGQLQDGQVAGARPGRRFVAVLRELFAKRAVYLESRHSKAPPEAEELGWVVAEIATPDGPGVALQPARGATRLGWADNDWLYLLPGEAYRAVSRFLGDTDQTLGATEQALHRDLRELGLIEVKQASDGIRYTVAVLLGEHQQRVLKLRRAALAVSEDE